MKYWKFVIEGYGTVFATGTEEHAEIWRRHKEVWEGEPARKYEVDPADYPRADWGTLDENGRWR